MIRFYRALLRLYPASFRAEYGEEMCAVFREGLAGAGGLRGRLALAVGAILDTLGSAAGTHGEICRQDLRHAVRAFRRAPGFVATAVLVVALGVGANTAAFSVADHVLLRPLPFPDPERLVRVWVRTPEYARMELSPATYRDWKSSAPAFETLAAFHRFSVNLVDAGAPERLEGIEATADLLPMLGAGPVLGRLFTPDETRPGVAGTVVLSYELWQGRFGGDPGLLGRRVLLDGEPYTVIGVLPRNFHFPSRDVALWIPLRLPPEAYEDRTDNYLHVVGRLRDGGSLEGARAELEVVAARLAREFPREYTDHGATVHRLGDELSEQSRLLLLALCGAALCILLIACANLAGLLLARAAARHHELALRTALGAGRERLLRQLLTESVLLAAAGGALGLLLARAALPLLTRLVPDGLPGVETPTLDLRVLLFAALLTGVTGLGFGVWPALRAGQDSSLGALRDDARSGGSRQRLRAALVIAEVTASVVLLISAGLLLRALWRIQATDPGFRPDGVLTLRTALPMPKYERTALRLAFYDGVLAEVRALPGVSEAAYASFLPMAMGGGIWPVILERTEEPQERRMASLRYVTPGYFATLAIPLRRGRGVLGSDSGERPAVAVVSESFAQRYWPGEDPIGRRFTFALQERTVVGVVGEVRVRGLERTSEPQVYLPAGQVPDGGIIYYAPKDLVVRFSGNPGLLLRAIRGIVQGLDPEQPISNVRLMEEIVADQTLSRSVQVRLLGALAAVALLLAGVGIHGLLSFTVSTRGREIGVRLALGARPADVVAMVLWQGLGLALAGVVPGALLAYAGGRAMEALLASIRPDDAATFAGVALLILAMTAGGSLAPTLRAVRVDPMAALRAE